jgi:hypothetical protein
MAGTTVTMQLNAGLNEAGDWANRAVTAETTATGWQMPAEVAERHVRHELAIRLHGLRGAVEAMRADANSVDLATSASADAPLTYGTPVAYQGLRFMLSPVS